MRGCDWLPVHDEDVRIFSSQIRRIRGSQSLEWSWISFWIKRSTLMLGSWAQHALGDLIKLTLSAQ